MSSSSWTSSPSLDLRLQERNSRFSGLNAWCLQRNLMMSDTSAYTCRGSCRARCVLYSSRVNYRPFLTFTHGWAALWSSLSQICGAQHLHDTCAVREKKLEHLSGWIEEQKEQLKLWEQPTSLTLTGRTLAEWEVKAAVSLSCTSLLLLFLWSQVFHRDVVAPAGGRRRGEGGGWEFAGVESLTSASWTGRAESLWCCLLNRGRESFWCLCGTSAAGKKKKNLQKREPAVNRIKQ